MRKNHNSGWHRSARLHATEVINQIGEEAAKPKPNKTLLKMLSNGLIAVLQAIPDVAKAVAAAAPLLTQLHL